MNRSNNPAGEAPASVRQVFDSALQATTDPKQRGKIELLREYYCNAEFREWMHGYTFGINAGKDRR